MKNQTDAETVTRLRAWLAADEERTRLEKDLPKATCRVCGGVAKAGEGTRGPERPTGARHSPANPSVLVGPGPGGPVDADDWRRECAACATATAAEIVGHVLGYEPDDADAHRVQGRMSVTDELGFVTSTFPFASVSGRGGRRPWAHVTRADRERVRRVLRDVIEERKPGPCVWGACGLCGVRTSLTWHEGPVFLRWPDGTPAPVCATCQEVLDRRPDPYEIEDLRALAVEAATGLAHMNYTAPPEFRLYAETRDCDGNGYSSPWQYSPALDAFRDSVWEDRPDLAPEHLRAEYEEKFRQRIETTRRKLQRQHDAAEEARW